MTEELELDDLMEDGRLRDGVVAAAVDRFARLREAKRALEEQIDRLHTAIGAHAKNTGQGELEGTTFKLKVSWTERASLPAANTDERGALERAVRRAGLWEQASSLSATKIRTAISQEDVSHSDREELQGLLVMKSSSRITLSKLKS